jgi:hypothetical protein
MPRCPLRGKLQITNYKQIPNPNVQNYKQKTTYVWNLVLGAWNFP